LTVWTLILRSLRFYWRTHLGVVLGAAVSATILVGALVVGDSVRASLRAMALARLGNVVLAMAPQDRFFRAALADGLGVGLRAPAATAPVLQLRGLAANGDGTARANRIQVLGVDSRFWALGPARNLLKDAGEDAVVLNDRLAAQLGVRPGDDVVIRVEEPSVLPRDAPLSTDTDSSVALRLTVAAIAADADFGRFSLQANQVPPYNAFLPLARLQGEVKQAARANLLLIGQTTTEIRPGVPVLDPPSEQLRRANAALSADWQLADAELELRHLPRQDIAELRSRRIFLDPPVARAARNPGHCPLVVLTYFVNEFRVGDRTAPYSMASALADESSAKDPRPWDGRPHFVERLIPPGMADDEVVINTWLAEDLQAKPGDTLEMSYYALGTMQKLETRKSTFRIRAIVPLEGLAADRELMPPFPGIAEAETCRDWRPGIPIDLRKIRKRDEEYWNQHRGTPKAFVTLAAGQRMWRNRFGDLTSVRYPGPMPGMEYLDSSIRRELSPASLGLFFQPVREQAMAASGQAMDFGQLFLGFSFFLIVAALLLMGLLFAFGIEQRTEEVGTLLALGFPPKTVRRLLLGEGAALAAIGSVVGAACGTLYTRLVLRGLSTVWQGAVAGASLQFHVEPSTLAIGAGASIFVAVVAMWLVLRRQARRPARELLAGHEELGSGQLPTGRFRRRAGLWIGVAALAGALLIVGWAGARKDRAASETFFEAGALLLIGGLSLAYALLSRLAATAKTARLTLGGLGVRNAARHRGRSLAVIGLLACGSFLIVAVGANRHDPTAEAHLRSSGTGGFALYGESALPVYRDLNSADGRKAFGLNPKVMEGVSIVQLRLREGDDASCLNLNRAQRPRLLGVRPGELATRHAFGRVAANEARLSALGWLLLDRVGREGPVPAVGDENTITWALGKSVGDTLPYPDEPGQTVSLRLAKLVGNSILQGSLLISEEEFVRLFPSESGYRVFLIDAAPERAEAVSKELSRALRDIGIELTPAARRLAEFNAVENTYLSIFQALGGLGLLLGSVGLGIVVLRNVLERRGELALLRAVGFPKRSVQWLVLAEHWGLVALGLACGVVAAVVAVLPALRSPGAGVPYVSLGITLAAVAGSSLLWTWLAAIAALRGPVLPALRNE